MADLDDIKEGKDFGIDRPQQNTLYTLKGCGSLDWGMQSRLARIFNPHSNRTVMLAFDHGYFQGPTTGLERIDLSIAPLFADTDVLMCTRGVLRSQVPAATNKPVVLRASGGNSILSELSNECVAVAMEDALRLNVCAVAAQRSQTHSSPASRSSMTMASRVSSERVLKRWSGWSMGVPADVIFICV